MDVEQIYLHGGLGKGFCEHKAQNIFKISLVRYIVILADTSKGVGIFNIQTNTNYKGPHKDFFSLQFSAYFAGVTAAFLDTIRNQDHNVSAIATLGKIGSAF